MSPAQAEARRQRRCEMKHVVCLASAVLLTTPGWGAPCKGDKDCGDITLGRPKVWSIRDAHYLIGEARQKLGALGIKGDLVLNPNEVNSRSLEILKTSFGVSAELDTTVAEENRQALRQSERKWEAYDEDQRVVARLDREILRFEDETAGNTSRMKALRAKKKRLEDRNAKIDEVAGETDATDATNAALTSEKRENERQIARIDDEIAVLTSENEALGTKIKGRKTRRDTLAAKQAPEPPSLTAVTPDAFGAAGSNGTAGFSDLTKSDAFNDGLKAAIEKVLSTDPQLHYSKQLDNLLDASMQLVSRRLALLRQSIDPSYELYFLELPTSINPNRSGKHHIAQARWSVTVSERNLERLIQDVGLLGAYKCEFLNACKNEDKKKAPSYTSAENWLASKHRGATLPAPDAQPYIYELSPSQSALNIARHSKRAKNFGLKGVIKLIGGLGVSTEYQKQREQYGQFMERPVFAAGQGKGKSVFGWDFAPMAGEPFVAPGTYTTFAVLAVPKTATQLDFKSDGFWARKPSKGRRETRKPEFKDEETFTVELPSYQRYWVSSIRYKSVPAGKPISVIIKGSGFSNETEVLVNNVPLERRMRLVDPETREVGRQKPTSGSSEEPQVLNTTASGSGTDSLDDTVKGEFEIVSPTSIVLRFRCGPDFVGIPQITFVAPSKSIRLNRLRLRVNDKEEKLDVLQADFENGKQINNVFFTPGSNWKRADVVTVVPDSRNGRVDLTLELHGVNLDNTKCPNDPKCLTYYTRRLSGVARGTRRAPA